MHVPYLSKKSFQLQEEGMNEMVYVFTCTNTHAIVWTAVSFGYKALLQLGAIFMAFTTRKVNIKALNDTKENCIMIYINSIILAILILTEFAFGRHPGVYTTVFGLAIFLEATLFLGVVFIPKVYISQSEFMLLLISHFALSSVLCCVRIMS